MVYNLNKSFSNDLNIITKIYILFRINKIEKFFRNCLIVFFKFIPKIHKDNEFINFTNIIDNDNLLRYKKKLEENNYVYVENFFDKNFYNAIKDKWPKKYMFRPPYGLDKFYDTGFIVKYDENLKLFNGNCKWLEKIYENLHSESFKKVLKDFSGYDLYFESSGLNQTRKGSYIALHLDDVEKDQNLYGSLNCIIILDSSESEACANLSLGSSNRWEDLYFKSPNLKNSALIYRIGCYHYHGFHPVKKNEFRKALNIRFLRK
jgi:hypothetical protein